MNIRKLLTVGGDERMLYTSQSLAEKGFDVEIFAPSPPAGFEHMRPTGDKSIDSAAARADAVILPLPVSRDGVHLNSSTLTLNELSDTLERGQTVFAGMMDGALKSSFFKKGIRVFDYFEREELAVNNAVPTAQGVIKIAMENMKITLHGARCAVTGYGRTAKVLADMLAALGARGEGVQRSCLGENRRARCREYLRTHENGAGARPACQYCSESCARLQNALRTPPRLPCDRYRLSPLRNRLCLRA